MKDITYYVNGEQFVLIPSTRKNVREFNEYYKSLFDDIKLDEIPKNATPEELLVYEEAMKGLYGDEYDLGLKVFVALTYGKHDKIDVDDFDMRMYKDALLNFLPQQMMR